MKNVIAIFVLTLFTLPVFAQGYFDLRNWNPYIAGGAGVSLITEDNSPLDLDTRTGYNVELGVSRDLGYNGTLCVGAGFTSQRLEGYIQSTNGDVTINWIGLPVTASTPICGSDFSAGVSVEPVLNVTARADGNDIGHKVRNFNTFVGGTFDWNFNNAAAVGVHAKIGTIDALKGYGANFPFYTGVRLTLKL